MNRTISGFFWISLYLGLVLAPLALMLAPPLPSGRAFWVEFSVALGFVGLTQIAVQFALIARFRRVTAPYGIDIILQYHRKIALVAIALIVAHPFLLLIEHPARIALFNPFGGTWGSKFGLLALVSLLVLAGTSVWREKLKLNYERWRVSHAVLGVVALAAAQAHVSFAGLYINTAWKQGLWIGSSVLFLSFVGWLRLAKPARQRRRPWRVAEVKDEGGDTYTLAIEPDGHDGLAFAPGQFAWIKVGDSPYTPDEHPYSFASSALRPDRIAFGIKALGDFSKTVPDMEAGTPVYLDGPHGAFSIDRFQAPGFVFLAGGIGITPFMSFLHTMADRGDPRPILLLYAAGSEDDLAYREELESLTEDLDLDLVYALEELPDRLTEEGSAEGDDEGSEASGEGGLSSDKGSEASGKGSREGTEASAHRAEAFGEGQQPSGEVGEASGEGAEDDDEDEPDPEGVEVSIGRGGKRVTYVQGMIDDDLLSAHLPDEGFVRRYFIVGPPPMMDAVEELLLERGVPQEDVHLEKFDLA